MTDLAALAARVREHIPLAEHLGFRLVSFSDHILTLTAPLDINVNDKGTMFAGSQAALMALAGWALTTLEAESVVARADVLAMQNSLRYRRPVTGDITIRVSTTATGLQRFQHHLRQGERAALTVRAEGVNADGALASQYRGEYLARAV